MQPTILIKTKVMLIMVSIILFASGVFAQDIKHNKTTYNSSYLSGTDIKNYIAGLGTPPISFTYDLPYVASVGDNMQAVVDFWSGTNGDFQVKSIRSYVKLYVDHNYSESAVEKIFQPYAYHVRLKLRGYPTLNDNNTFVEFEDTLMVAYIPDSTLAYQDVHMKSYFGYYKLEAQVVEIYDVTGMYYPASPPTPSGIPFLGGYYLPTAVAQSTYTITPTGKKDYTLGGTVFSGLLYDQVANSGCENASCLKLNWKLELGLDYQKFDINMTGGANPSTVYSNSMSGITLNPQVTAPTAADNSLKIDWSYYNISTEKPNGANYELEWVYVDDYSVEFNGADMTVGTKSSANCLYNFNENATRIITDKTNYSIPLIYKKGYLVYRVRLVRPDNLLYQSIKYSPWSLTDDEGTIQSLGNNHNYHITTAHLSDGFNWNYQNSFAEEGKSKAVLNYFDGLLKNRQSITRFSSLPQQLIVTEPYYNYEGAVGMQTLPVPVTKNPATDNKFEFLAGFTDYNNTGSIKAADFDSKATPINNANLLLDLSPSTSLAAKYYSSGNPLLANVGTSPYLKAIPDAEGFPLIQTKYLPDDNSRVKIQGGAGKELQIGKGHETKFYYSDPEQNELTKYLGLHAGFSEFYEKTITLDPNKQLSFSISNNLGKPVMTGLMGSEPSINQNADLPILPIDGVAQVPNNNQATNLLLGKKPKWEGRNRILYKTYFNDIAGSNLFSYKCEVSPFQMVCDDGITNSGVYLNVPMEYEITAVDEDNNTYAIQSNSINPANMNFVGNTAANLQVNLNITNSSINVGQGDVDLKYSLSYKREDVDKAVDNLLTNPQALNLTFPNDCQKTQLDFLKEEMENLNDACDNENGDDQSDCSNWEDKMKKQLYPDNVYGKYQQYGKTHTTIVGDRKSLYAIVGWTHPNLTLTLYNLVVGNTIEDRLATDPYVVVHLANFVTQASDYISMDFDQKSDYFDKLVDEGYKPVYKFQELLVNYLQGNPYTGPLLPNALQIVPTAQQLIDNFNDEYANAFLPVHPEFEEYKKRYCDNVAGADFINQLKSIPDFETAKMLGLTSLSAIIDKDPFYAWRHNIDQTTNVMADYFYAGYPNARIPFILMYYSNPYLNVAANTLAPPNSMMIPIDRYAYIKTICRNIPDEFAKFNYLNYTQIAGSTYFEYSIGLVPLEAAIGNLNAENKDIYIQELITHYLLNREKLTEIVQYQDVAYNAIALSQTPWMNNTQMLPIVDASDGNSYTGNQIFENYINPANDETGIPDFAQSPYNDIIADPAPSPTIKAEELAKNYLEEYADYIVAQLRNCTNASNILALDITVNYLGNTISKLQKIKEDLKSRMILNHTIKNDKLWKGGITPEIVKEILLDNGIVLDELCNPFLIDYQKSNKSMVNFSKCTDAAFFSDMEKSVFWNNGVASATENAPFNLMDIVYANTPTTITSGTITYPYVYGVNSFDDIIYKTLGYSNNEIRYIFEYTAGNPVTGTNPYTNNVYTITPASSLVFTFSNPLTNNVVVLNLDLNTTYNLNGYFAGQYNLLPSPYIANITGNTAIPNIFSGFNCSDPPPSPNFVTKGRFKDVYCTSNGAGQIWFNAKYINCVSAIVPNPSFTDHTHCLFYFEGTIEGLDIDNQQSECITPLEMKKAFQDYKTDVVDEYHIKGEGHPFYETSIRSYFNYKFRKMNTSEKYLQFIEGCNLTDQFEIPKYYSYLQAHGSNANINSLISYIKNYLNDELKDIDYFQYESGGIDYLNMNFSSIYKDERLRKLIKDATTNNPNVNLNFNKLNSELGGGIPSKSIDFFVDQNVTFVSAAVNALSPTTTVVTMKHNNISALFDRYHIDLSSYSDEQLAEKIDIVRNELANYEGAYVSFSTHQSNLNSDNKEIDKKAYLKWAYAISPSYDNEQMINELKRTKLKSDVYDGAYLVGGAQYAGDYDDAGDYISFLNPDNKKLNNFTDADQHVSSTLYIANNAANEYGLNFIKHIFDHTQVEDLGIANVIYTNNFNIVFPNPSSIFYPRYVYQINNIAANSFLANTYTGGNADFNGTYNIKFRKLDEHIYWFKIRETGYAGVPRYFNIYLNVPDYLTQEDLMNFSIANPSTDIKTIINSNEVKRFSILFTNPNAAPNTQATFTAYGRTDFKLNNATPIVYENVMLCDDDNYIDSLESCFDGLVAHANDNAAGRFYQYMEDKREKITNSFEQHLKNAVIDELSLQRVQKKYAITLYKYDRAGNLITTIPPEGVLPINDNLFPSADIQRNVAAYDVYDQNTYLPVHKKESEYTYNSINQLVTQSTPDGGETLFYYDPSGKLVFSQNAKQNPVKKYSYTLYDDQNRIIETGQLNENIPIKNLMLELKNYNYSASLLNNGNATIRNIVYAMQRSEVVRTFYDAPLYEFATLANSMSQQENLRGRVASIANYDIVFSTGTNLNNLSMALHYSYDLSGNVKTLTYDMPALDYLQQRYKRIDYDYDLYSGKVNLVSYNRGFQDQFYQQYEYDDDNRITKVQTSQDGVLWDKDAQYTYYPHGPLARITLGDLQVQGIDFAYTLQGWLKYINGDAPTALNDIGGDFYGNNVYMKDLLKSSLNYFQNDYKAIDPTNNLNANSMNKIPAMPLARSLYNGNIASSVSIPGYFNSLYTDYWYDQLNRIKEAKYKIPDYTVNSVAFDDVVKNFSTFNNNTIGAGVTADDLYRSKYEYSFDGNLKTLQRFGLETDNVNKYDITNSALNPPAKVFKMDNISYHYDPNALDGNNKLINYSESIDHTANTTFDNDLQIYPAPGNAANPATTERFKYDAIGNMIKDLTNPNELSSINWSLYGKVLKVSMSDSKYMNFKYEPGGNRFMKSVVSPIFIGNEPGTSHINEYYIREASGNILAIYKQRQDFTYENPLATVLGDIIDAPNFAQDLAYLYGDNASFKSALLENIANEYETFTALKVQNPASFYLKKSASIKNALLSNNITLIPDMLATHRPMLESTVNASFDYEILKPAVIESNDSIKTIFRYHLVDTNSQAEMLSLLSAFGYSATSITVADYIFQLNKKINRMTSSEIESAFATAYSSSGPNTFFSETISRLLSDSFYVFKTYPITVLSFGCIKNHLVSKLQGAGNVDTLAEYYDNLTSADSLLEVSASPYDQLTVVYEDSTESFINGFKAEQDANISIANSLNTIEGMNPSSFALKWSALSVDNAADVNLALTPVLSKEKFFLAEHHMYGSSRLGIKKYWPNQYLFEWNTGVPVNMNGAQFADVELASHRPWYSQAYNSMISTNTTVPWGNANTNQMASERILGQKQYELTNHLGNVMAVVLDKITEAPTDLNVATYPTDVNKRASLSASYDYYPFGMLMPGRYSEDETQQCTYITKTRYLPQLLLINDVAMNDMASMALFTQGAQTETEMFPEQEFISVYAAQNATENTTLSTIFTAQQLNQEVTINTNIENRTSNAVNVSLLQQDANEEWQVLDNQSVSSTAEIQLQGNTISMSPLKVVYSSVNGNFNLKGLNYVVKDMFAVSYMDKICNTDADFKDDYRFGFNGQEKDNEVKGVGNSLDFGARIYDSRLGKWLSLDPLQAKYPFSSPYIFTANNPIVFRDKDGRESKVSIDGSNMTFSATVYVWAGASEQDKALAVQKASEFQTAFNQWDSDNKNKGTATIGNVTYNIQIQMTFVVATADDVARIQSQASEEASENLLEVNAKYSSESSSKGAGDNYERNKVIPTNTQLNDIKSGNKINMNPNENAAIAIHAVLHVMGLGDRYSIVSYEFSNYDGSKSRTPNEAYSHVGYEDDMMGAKPTMKSSLNGEHFMNLATKALSVQSQKSNATDFILGREVDRTSNADSKVVPQSFKSGKTEYSNPKNRKGN